MVRQQPSDQPKRKVTAASLPMVMVAKVNYQVKSKKQKSNGELALTSGNVLLVEDEDPSDPASWYTGRKFNGKMGEAEAGLLQCGLLSCLLQHPADRLP